MTWLDKARAAQAQPTPNSCLPALLSVRTPVELLDRLRKAARQ